MLRPALPILPGVPHPGLAPQRQCSAAEQQAVHEALQARGGQYSACHQQKRYALAAKCTFQHDSQNLSMSCSFFLSGSRIFLGASGSSKHHLAKCCARAEHRQLTLHCRAYAQQGHLLLPTWNTALSSTYLSRNSAPTAPAGQQLLRHVLAGLRACSDIERAPPTARRPASDQLVCCTQQEGSAEAMGRPQPRSTSVRETAGHPAGCHCAVHSQALYLRSSSRAGRPPNSYSLLR